MKKIHNPHKSRALHLKLSTDRGGVILIAVTAMTIVMSLLAISLMSLNGSATISNQKQIDRIKAEQLATGAFWYNYMNLSTSGTTATPPGETLDGKTYTPTITSAAGGPNSTTIYNSTVSF